MYRVIENECRGFNNLSYTIHLDRSMQLHQWIKKFSKFSFMMCDVHQLCIFLLGAQFTKMAVNRSEKAFYVERTRLSCLCLQNHKGCTYRAPVRYVTKTWRVVLLNEKIHILLTQVYLYDKLLKPRQSFLITLYFPVYQTTRHRISTYCNFNISIVCLFQVYIKTLPLVNPNDQGY